MGDDRKCSKCGKEIGIGMFSLVSDMCDNCYEKVHFYTPENQYIKETIKMEFVLPEGKYSQLTLLMYHHECEQIIYNKIKELGRKRNQYFASVFCEFDIVEKTNELIRNGKFELEYSYFFSNDRFNSVSNFEDRNKQKSLLICFEAE